MEKINKNPRLLYIDQLKGFAILLVVIGHVSLFCGGSDGVIYDCICLFHMPLFFLLSGLVTRQIEEGKVSYLLKKMRVILIPFVAWGGLMTMFRNETLFEFLTDFMKGGYWFLWVLFEFYIFHIICDGLSKIINKKSILLIDLGILLLLYIMLKIGYHFISEYQNNIVGYLHWICYLPYFMGGVLIKKYDLVERILSSGLLYTIAFFTLLVITIFNIHFANIGFVIASSIIIVIGSFFYQVPSNLITDRLAFIGRHTLGIYVIHYFLLPYIYIVPILKLLIGTCNYIVEAVLLVFISIVICMLCILAEQFLQCNKYLGIIFLGKNK